MLVFAVQQSDSATHVVSWPKSAFGFFHEVLQKNPNKLFGRPKTQIPSFLDFLFIQVTAEHWAEFPLIPPKHTGIMRGRKCPKAGQAILPWAGVWGRGQASHTAPHVSRGWSLIHGVGSESFLKEMRLEFTSGQNLSNGKWLQSSDIRLGCH